ncbi:sulfite exporter TauE/SafE family protein, partial [archaeon]|nr:sulfite exporter TauE/SafE family protein [archaeon]
MELSVILFIIIIGFLTGILASLIGIGGGLIIVPSMIFFFDLLPSQATLISSFVIIF